MGMQMRGSPGGSRGCAHLLSQQNREAWLSRDLILKKSQNFSSGRGLRSTEGQFFGFFYLVFFFFWGGGCGVEGRNA